MGPTIKTKLMHCTYRNNQICNFGGASKCIDKQWGNPEECILYQLIEDNEKLKEKVRKLELSVNKVSTATTTSSQ